MKSNNIWLFINTHWLGLFSLIMSFSLIAYSAYLFFSIYQTMKIAEKLVANTRPYEQHPQNPDKYILVAGDSTALGVGALNMHESTAGRFGEQFPNADITNLGMNGAMLKDLLITLQNQKNEHYDLIVLQIGANDITHLTSYDAIQEELSKILFLSNKISPKTILLTSGNIGAAPVFHWPLSTYLTARTLNVRNIFKDEASKFKSVFYIDLYKDTKDDPFIKDPERHYAPDSFHLSGDGYEIWFKEIKMQGHLTNY